MATVDSLTLPHIYVPREIENATGIRLKETKLEQLLDERDAKRALIRITHFEGVPLKNVAYYVSADKDQAKLLDELREKQTVYRDLPLLRGLGTFDRARIVTVQSEMIGEGPMGCFSKGARYEQAMVAGLQLNKISLKKLGHLYVPL